MGVLLSLNGERELRIHIKEFANRPVHLVASQRNGTRLRSAVTLGKRFDEEIESHLDVPQRHHSWSEAFLLGTLVEVDCSDGAIGQDFLGRCCLRPTVIAFIVEEEHVSMLQI